MFTESHTQHCTRSDEMRCLSLMVEAHFFFQNLVKLYTFSSLIIAEKVVYNPWEHFLTGSIRILVISNSILNSLFFPVHASSDPEGTSTVATSLKCRPIHTLAALSIIALYSHFYNCSLDYFFYSIPCSWCSITHSVIVSCIRTRIL